MTTYATINVVLSVHKDLRPSWIRLSVSVSTALVASSSRIICGCFNIARAIATRCFSPPESLLHKCQCLVKHDRGFYLHATVADFRIITYKPVREGEEKHGLLLTIWERHNLVVDRSCSTGLVDVLISGRESSVANVVHDGVVEKGWILWYYSNVLTETDIISLQKQKSSD